jgi:hypothetical protein
MSGAVAVLTAPTVARLAFRLAPLALGLAGPGEAERLRDEAHGRVRDCPPAGWPHPRLWLFGAVEYAAMAYTLTPSEMRERRHPVLSAAGSLAIAAGYAGPGPGRRRREEWNRVAAVLALVLPRVRARRRSVLAFA